MAQGRIELITDRDALRSHEPGWRDLAERRHNAFITPEWFRVALDVYRASTEPAVLVVWRPDGSLLGLMPLVVATSGRPRTLRFGGAVQADHLHPVCLSEDEESVAAAGATILSQITERWTVVVLDNVNVEAPWWRALSHAPDFVGTARCRDTVLPAIELGAGGWEAYLATRGRNFREQVRRYPRRLERSHRVVYRRTAEESELDRDMATFFRLHDARRHGRGGSSLAGERARRFQLEFARAALQRGWLRLWFLELDGAPVAAWYGWHIGERYAYYQAGFDPRFAHLSVGFVLMVHTVRAALEDGASHYDMLLGDEAYKARFTNTNQAVQTVTLSRSRSAHLLTAAEARMWKGSRRLSPRLRSLPSSLAARLPTARRR